jgi:integrase
VRRTLGSITELVPGKKYRIYAPGVMVDGKRHRPTRVVRGTFRQAERELAKLLTQQGHVTTLTYRDFLEAVWVPHIEEKCRPVTVDEYALVMEAHVVPLLGSVALDALAPEHVRSVMARIADRKPATRRKVFAIMRASLKLAEKRGFIQRSPTDFVAEPKVPWKQPQVLSLEEMNALLDAFEGDALEPLVVVALATGMRRGEIAALTRDDFDLETGVVEVSKSMTPSGSVTKPKTAWSEREVSLPPWAIERLKACLPSSGPILGGMLPESLRDAYKRRCEDLEVTYTPLRQLRHTHLTLALDHASLLDVSRRAGHGTTVVTQTIYIGPRQKANADLAASLEGLRVRQSAPNASKGEPRSARRKRPHLRKD